MIFVTFKCAYSTLLKTSRLRLRFKSSARNFNFVDLIEDMTEKNLLIPDRTDLSLSFVGLGVLGNTSTVSPCSVSLNTPCRSYLFNCGEGIQKVMSEYKIKPSRIQDIFITYPSWKNIGGIVGATLSMQESNVKFLTIHGHNCLRGYFDIMRQIANFKGIKQNIRLCEHRSTFSDEYIKVEFIKLQQSALVSLNKSTTESAFDETSRISEESNSDNKKEQFTNVSTSTCESKDSNIIIQKQSHSEDMKFRYKQNYAISFIIHTEKSQGSLSFEKCMEFGVPVGPLLGKLKKGEDVELENGNIVKSSDVKYPDLPGVIIIVVECPTEEYLDSLINEPAFFKHQSDNEEYFTCAVVHFSNSKVIQSQKYQEWMNRFSKETKHIFVNEASEIGAYVGLHRNQFKLNMVHPKIFPTIHAFGIPDYPRVENSSTAEGHLVKDVQDLVHEKNSPLQIYSDKVHYQCENNMPILGETLCEVYLKPKRTYDYSKCLTLKKNEYLREVLAASDFMKKLETFKKNIKNVETVTELNKRIYPKIVFLGTGSKKPSKTRNSSGILVFLDDDKSIILDCGESIYCQLLICFGKEEARKILRNLSAIFISHLHIDHHLGLMTLLIERKLAFDELNELDTESDPLASGKKNNFPFEPLKIIAPVQILPMLHYFSDEIYQISDLYRLIPCGMFLNPIEIMLKSIIRDLNLESLKTVVVKHAQNSFGVSLKHKDGWKLTYSGDTKPCNDLVSIGKDSDILIHEATFDDIYEKEAEEKLHTTTGQAILIGRQMNAKFILLTHFSQRYCHLPMIKDELLSKHDVGVAFDFMQVSPYQFPILPYLYEPIKLVFTVYQERMEQQNYLLKLRRERGHSSGASERPVKIPRMKNS